MLFKLDDPRDVAALTVGDVMTPNPITVTPKTALNEVLEIMLNRHILHFPVMDGERLVGILSERNLRDAQPSVLMLKDRDARRGALARARVEHVMKPNPTTTRSDARLREAIFRMETVRTGCLPVVDESRLVGVLTSGDLLVVLRRVVDRAASWA